MVAVGDGVGVPTGVVVGVAVGLALSSELWMASRSTREVYLLSDV